MSRLPEQRLWDRMRGQRLFKGILMKRIENMVDVGMPDVIANADGLVTMCELKQRDVPPERADRSPLLGEKYGLSIEQRNWLMEWDRAGGRGLIIAGAGVGRGCRVYVAHARHAEVVNTWTATEWAWRGMGWDDVLKGLLT